jgi:hypothetical protein
MRKQTEGDTWVVVERPRESWFERGFDFASGLMAAYFLFFVLAPIAGLVLGAMLLWLLGMVF